MSCGPGALMSIGVSGALAAGVYLLAGAGLSWFWQPRTLAPVPEPPAAPAGPPQLAEVREELAQRLFCAPCPALSETPCPEAEVPRFSAWQGLAVGLSVGALSGVCCVSCCCGSALAGYGLSRHGPTRRTLALQPSREPRPILW